MRRQKAYPIGAGTRWWFTDVDVNYDSFSSFIVTQTLNCCFKAINLQGFIIPCDAKSFCNLVNYPVNPTSSALKTFVIRTMHNR